MSNSCNPVDCSPSGSSVHELLQARILEWVAISFFKGKEERVMKAEEEDVAVTLRRHSGPLACITGRRNGRHGHPRASGNGGTWRQGRGQQDSLNCSVPNEGCSSRRQRLQAQRPSLTAQCTRSCSPSVEWLSLAVGKSTTVARHGPSLQARRLQPDLDG